MVHFVHGQFLKHNFNDQKHNGNNKQLEYFKLFKRFEKFFFLFLIFKWWKSRKLQLSAAVVEWVAHKLSMGECTMLNICIYMSKFLFRLKSFLDIIIIILVLFFHFIFRFHFSFVYLFDSFSLSLTLTLVLYLFCLCFVYVYVYYYYYHFEFCSIYTNEFIWQK